MPAPPKSVDQYEREARRVGGCLIHPSIGAARKVYQKRHGKLPSEILVCHTCDNPACIEDRHHFTGTRRDNCLDAVRKGRHSCFRKGGVRFSGPHSDESKKRIGADAARRWADPEYKRRMSAALTLAWRSRRHGN